MAFPRQRGLRTTARRLCVLMLVAVLPTCVASFQTAAPVAAQEDAGTIAISRLEADDFPQMTLYFEAHDEQGQFISDLTRNQVSILENDAVLTPDELQPVEPGVQVMVAYNLSANFANRSAGVSRFAAIQTALLAWAAANPPTLNDDLSLISNTGLQTIRMRGSENWQLALETFQPDLATQQSSLLSLSEALDLATDPNPSPLMKRFLLYVTPLPQTTALDALANLSARASQLGVRVCVWLVAPATAPQYSAEQVAALQAMADLTGGQLFIFSGSETLPDLETWVAPLRQVYRADWTSRIAQSGNQLVGVQVQRRGQELASGTQTFAVDVQPPNPIFLAPPQSLDLGWTRPSREVEARIVPASIEIEALIEFGDGHPRALQATRLYANGELVAENLEEPFDRFTWRLSDYQQSGTVVLQLEAIDRLGLSKKSIQLPVELNVAARPNLSLFELLSRDQWLIVGACAVALLVLITVLHRRRRVPALSRRQKRRLERDPLTQPVPIRSEPARKSAAPRPTPSGPPALLRRLPDSDDLTAALHADPVPGNPIPLARRELTLGRDPRQAMIVIDLPSVDPLHARLYRASDGSLYLADAGSAAGTWVNFAPVSARGVRLEHGDLVHIGRAAFRFEYTRPGQQQQPKVLPYEEEHP